MRVKSYQIPNLAPNLALCLAVILFGGCSTLERIAPPGFVKYEDLEKDTPPNPEIQARIEARNESGERSFPNLSETPSAKPSGATAEELEAQRARLLAERDELNEGATADREAAEAERLLEAAAIESQRDTRWPRKLKHNVERRPVTVEQDRNKT